MLQADAAPLAEGIKLEGVRLVHGVVEPDGLVVVATGMLHPSLQQQHVLMVGHTLHEPVGIGQSRLRVAHRQQRLAAKQAGVAHLAIEGDGLGQLCHSRHVVVLSGTGLSQRVVQTCIAAVDGQTALADVVHLCIVLVHKGDMCHLLIDAHVVGLSIQELLQLGDGGLKVARLHQRLCQIVAYLQIVVHFQRLAEALHGIVILADAHGLDTIVLQQVEVTLLCILLLFLGGRLVGTATKQRLEKSHVLSMIYINKVLDGCKDKQK